MAIRRDDKRTFTTLDGLRGVAALFVAMRHTTLFKGLNIHGGYLAVDLFFVLSGFVIAHAYEGRLAQGLSPTKFLAQRYLRLLPVYVLGAVIGLIAAANHALPGRDNMPLADVARTAPFALAMLPGPHIKPMLYPVNSVAWSLALELLVNAVYAFTWRWLRDVRVLVSVLVGSATALAAACLWFGKLDIGFQWTDAIGGLPRVIFSFTAGLAVYRLFRAEVWRSRVPALALLAVLPLLLWVKLDEVVYPLICVIAVFPAMVFAAAQVEPSRRLAPAMAWLGAVSYPLYALHKPCGELFNLLLRNDWPAAARSGAWIGVPYMAALVVICALVERHYDLPMRRLLAAGLDDLSASLAQLRQARTRGAASEPGQVAADQGA